MKITDEKIENLLNQIDDYATSFDYGFRLPLYDDITFADDYTGKQPKEELKDIVKDWLIKNDKTLF